MFPVITYNDDIGVRTQYTVYDDLGISVIAQAVCTDNGNDVRIDLVSVNRGYRGKGVGTRLLNKLLDQFSHRPMVVTTWPNLVPWYSRFGFRVVGQLKGIYHMRRNAAQ
ncbi:MAG: GNAT family N-acetyltransferase [Candidatus Ranarchaeia archaeon]